MSTNKYRQAYASLGEERVQVITKGQAVDKRTLAEIKRGVKFVDTYWDTRFDESWSRMPGYFAKNRKTKQKKFFSHIPRILIKLEPTNTFNPIEKWEEELAMMAELSSQSQANSSSSNSSKMSKKEKIIADNAASLANTKFVKEVTRVRNSKKNLLGILRDIKIPDARAILIIQILKNAYEDYKKGGEKKLLFETLWAIEDAVRKGSLPTCNAPKPLDDKSVLVKDPSLVYDDYSEVEKLLKKARKVMSQESDMIKLQLVEMSDSLPPLSKFTFGHKLDPWQKRVLTWIDAGKSVVICAPTSSGKTVLSSYVAVIFKAAALSSTAKEEQTKGASTKNAKKASSVAAARVVSKSLDDEEEEEDDDEEEEDGYEYFEEDDEEEDDEGDPASELRAADGSIDGSLEQQQLQSVEQLESLTAALVAADRAKRESFYEEVASDRSEGQKVLFVVPTEPLVWQVAAYFTKLLRNEGDVNTKVGIVTDQLTYYPPKKFDLMPQIVVGTPLALENALTKARGLVGINESKGKAQGDLLPGGFDRFDWVIYDEVHSLDGNEGAALQRLIRSMNCKFLALSATVGNAEELREWMERVKGDYSLGMEVITVKETDIDVSAGSISLSEEEMDSKKLQQPSIEEGGGGDDEMEKKKRVFAVKVVKTLTCESRVVTVADPNLSLANFKELLVAQWPQLVDPALQQHHTRNAFQLVWKGKDLVDDSAPLSRIGLFHDSDPEGGEEVVHLRLFVNMLTHQGRFINLQRYVWTKGTLQAANPLLAIDSVEQLKQGVLNNSSLSFTSRDSYKLWEEMKRIYPVSEDTCHPVLKELNPYNFFGKNERITLQRTKDYEDLLKSGLQILAEQYPAETLELLFAFQIQDPPKTFDLCDLVLELKSRDMLPCLPFHLNTFEAIGLFQHLLAGIEYRQKCAHPTYYLDQQLEKEARRKEVEKKIQATGKNDKALEDLAKAGDVDLDENFDVNEYAPHPNFTFSNGMPLSQIELDNLLDEMEQNDGFEKREQEAMSKMKGQNQAILKHALIRGLRRGIGLFIDEVSFSSYRRAVQRLASAGKLAVVISDDSLAFGVNMPFRTCIFCGEMFGQLDELMAQQMSGRAGRRGLDTQGNIVYSGMRISHIRRLMIGKVSHITGRNHNPRYESIFLQPLLSPRHVGWNRAEIIGGRTLFEHVTKTELSFARFTMEESKRIMLEMEFIRLNESTGRYVPNERGGYTYAILSTIWQLRGCMHESVSLGALLPRILSTFDSYLGTISLNEKKQNSDKIEVLVLRFLTIFLLIVGRSSYEEALESSSPSSSSSSSGVVDAETESVGPMRLQDLQYFSNPSNLEVLTDWTRKFAHVQNGLIREACPHLCDPVGPEMDLDGTFMQCVLERKYIHTLSDERKQQMKAKLWHLGTVLKDLTNCCWPDEKHSRVAFFLFRAAFNKLKYLNAELIRGRIDFSDVSALEREKRSDKEAKIDPPSQALPWSDNSHTESSCLAPNSFVDSIDRCLERIQLHSTCDRKALLSAFNSLSVFKDEAIIEVLADGFDQAKKDQARHLAAVADAVSQCSFASQSPPRIIGTLSWILLRKQPSSAQKLSMYLKTLYDQDVLSEEDILGWYRSDPVQLLQHIPRSTAAVHSLGGSVSFEKTAVTEAELEGFKKKAEIIIKFLETEDDEDEGDDEDEED